MSKVKVNEKQYEIRAFDVNMNCDLEDMGIEIADIQRKTNSFIRAYFAISANITKEEAGKELNEHFIKNGSFDELNNAIIKEIDESDFFRKLIESATEKDQQNQSKKGKAEKTTTA